MENDLSQYLHLYGCSPVCVRKCRVRLADRGNIFPQYLHVYFCLALEAEAVKAAEFAEVTEAATAAAAGVILNIGGLGRPPNIGWYLKAGVCKNLAAILVYKSKCG